MYKDVKILLRRRLLQRHRLTVDAGHATAAQLSCEVAAIYCQCIPLAKILQFLMYNVVVLCSYSKLISYFDVLGWF